MNRTLDKTLIAEISARVAYHYHFLPLERKNGTLRVLVSDAGNLELLDAIGCELNTGVVGVEVPDSEITDGLKLHYGVGAETLEGIIESRDEESKVLGASHHSAATDLSDLTADASIVKFVNQIILEAYQDRATDVHFEPFEGRLRIRYRIDGMLHEASVPQNVKHFQDAITSRVKIMADMNIAEKRVPQDGRIRMRVGSEELDLRVSVLPIAHGESVNLRILQRGSVQRGLKELGYRPEGLALLDRAMNRPHGIVLMTGPTGCGKTTTLYACLSKMNTASRKILTIEDPVEYEIEGLCQMQVHSKIGFTFADGLRSMLRHDPNIMLVGEIRDFETAELAIRAALTGHLVFSTLHTNDAPGAIIRLIDLGVESFLVASSLECIVAQRLVRLICDHCREQVRPADELRESLEVGIDEWREVKFYAGAGCDECRGSGFRGRMAIHEILIVNDDIREMITSRVSTGRIKNIAQEQGMTTLREDGWRRVVEGVTTAEEVLRVTEGRH